MVRTRRFVLVILLIVVSILLSTGLLWVPWIESDLPMVTDTPEEDIVTLRIFQNKYEVADVLRKLSPVYQQDHPGVRLEFESIGAGGDYISSLRIKFDSGEAPDVFTCEGYSQLDSWLFAAEDLSDQPWVKDLYPGAVDPVTRDGRILGFPEAYEGFGFAYNKAVFRRAGIASLPDSLPELETVCQTLQAAGITPFANGYAEWWVLANHNLSILLVQQPDFPNFLQQLETGRLSLHDGRHAQGWVDLLDLTLRYGQPDPTALGDYISTVADFASGKVAMIQQGNWIQPLLDKADPDLDVGFLPMPVSDESDPRIPVGVPNFFVVNREGAAKDEAKAWLDWLVHSERGRAYLTDELKYVPTFRTIETPALHGLNAALAEKIASGQTYPWLFPQLPEGSTIRIALTMTDYIDGRIDRTGLLDGIGQNIVDARAVSIN